MIRSATFGGVVIGGLLAVFVFAVKYEVQDLEAEFGALNRGIEQEHQSIHVLLAEWSHLNEPARIRKLARKHLGLEGLSVRQMGGLRQIPMRTEPVQEPSARLAAIQAAVREVVANDRLSAGWENEANE